MNRLELAQQLRSDCGISGSDATTIGARGEWLDVVSWIDRALRDIELQHNSDWLWMRKSASFVTVAEQAEYPYDSAPLSLTNFGRWINDTFRIYKTSISNEIRLNQWKDYDQFRDAWLISTLRTSYAQPSEIVISPSKSLILALTPNDTSYTVTGDYQRKPQVLALDDDTPEMPERYHMAIVYRAMMFAAIKESAAELYDFGKEEYRRLQAQMEIDQLPRLVIQR